MPMYELVLQNGRSLGKSDSAEELEKMYLAHAYAAISEGFCPTHEKKLEVDNICLVGVCGRWTISVLDGEPIMTWERVRMLDAFELNRQPQRGKNE